MTDFRSIAGSAVWLTMAGMMMFLTVEVVSIPNPAVEARTVIAQAEAGAAAPRA